MCGGHGLYHLIGALAAAPAAQPSTDVIQAVKLMYARGDLDTETFHRLMTMAQGGYLTSDDLLRINQMPQHPKNAALAESRHAVSTPRQEPRLHELEAELSRLLAQAEHSKRSARRPNLTDEEVQAFVETSQGALFRAQALQREIAALQEADGG